MSHQNGVLNKFMKYVNLTSIVSIYVLLLLWNLKWKSNNLDFIDIFSNPELTLLFSILTAILFLLVASKDKSNNHINFAAKSMYLLALVLLAISFNRVIQLLYNHEYIYNNEIICSNSNQNLLPPSDFQFNVDMDYKIDYNNLKINVSIKKEDVKIDPESSSSNVNRRLDEEEKDEEEKDGEEKDGEEKDGEEKDGDEKGNDVIKVPTKKRLLKVIPSFFIRFTPSCDSRSLYAYIAEHILTPITVSGIIVFSLIIRFFSLIKSRTDLKNIVHFVSLSTLILLAVTFIMMDHTESVIFNYSYLEALNTTLIPIKMNFGKLMDDSVRVYSQFIFSSVPFVWIYILVLRVLVILSLLLVYFKRSFKMLIVVLCGLTFVVNISGIIFRHERLVNKLFFDNKNIDYIINQSSTHESVFSGSLPQGNFLIDEEDKSDVKEADGKEEEIEEIKMLVGGKRIAFVQYCKEKLIYDHDISNKFELNLDEFCLSNRYSLLLALMDFSLVVWLYVPNLILSFLCFILVIVTNKKSTNLNSAENKKKLLNTLIMDLSNDTTEDSDEMKYNGYAVNPSYQPSYIPRIGSVVSPVNSMSPHYRRPAYIPLNHSHHGSTYTPSLTPCDTPTKQ